jgi:enoyl-CoA hydratase/carnithine racemase
MSDILTEHTDGILRVQLNRPAQKNAMTSAMYTNLADILNEADKDDAIRVVLWHSTGNVFCAGNDVVDFLKNPPRPGAFPQGDLMEAFVRFEKPIVAAVQGAAIGGGTTMLTHCDFVYAVESAKFQLPFINLRPGAGVRIELFDTGARGPSPGGGIVLAGRALHGRAGS